MQIKLIFTRKVVHFIASFSFWEPGGDLFVYALDFKTFAYMIERRTYERTILSKPKFLGFIDKNRIEKME